MIKSNTQAEDIDESSINFELLYKSAKTLTNYKYFVNKGLPDTVCKVVNGDACFPLIDRNGTITGLQLISPDGKKKFAKGSKKKGAGYFIEKLDSSTILVSEGVATALSLHKATHHSSFACFDAGNILSCVKMLQGKFPKKQIIICADNDAYSETNVGIDKAREVSQALGVPYCRPLFKDTDTKPTDFNDLYQLEGVEAVAKIVMKVERSIPLTLVSDATDTEATASPDTADGDTDTTEPYGFEKRNRSLYKITREGSFRIGGDIEVVSTSADANDENYSMNFSFTSGNKKKRLIKMPRKAMANGGREVVSALLDNGYDLVISKKTIDAFIEYISKVKPSKTILSTDKVGWHKVNDKNVFHTGIKVYPETEADNIIYVANNDAKFAISGTHEQWHDKIGRYFTGNPILILTASVGFAGPLLKPVGGENGGINIHTISGKGKSTSVKVAGSIFGSGGENGFVKQFRNTDNSSERQAERHNDCLLILDEVDQADEKTLFKLLYMLANGQGKTRMMSTTNLNKLITWRELILSTSEKSIEEKLKSCGAKYQAGLNTRFCDVEYQGKHGVFDNIHEFKTADGFANHLNYATTKYYGTAFDKYLNYITEISHEDMKLNFEKNYDELKDCYKLKFFDSQVLRVLRRFALKLTGLKYAIDAKVIDVSQEEALSTVKMFFELWVEGRGTKGRLEDTQVIQQIRYFFQTNQSKFHTLSSDFSDKQPFHDLGYIKNLNGIDCFLVKSEVFRDQVCKSHGRKRILEILKKYDLLLPDKNGNPARSENCGSQRTTFYGYCIKCEVVTEFENPEHAKATLKGLI